MSYKGKIIMTSRQRIRELYYSDEKPSNKKYLLIGALVVVIALVVFFTFSSEAPPQTTTTIPGVDVDTQVFLIKNKLNRVVSDIDRIEESQSGQQFSTLIDELISEI